MLTPLSLLLLVASNPAAAQPRHEQLFMQILARYQAASEAANRPVVLCLEPKFHLSKALIVEYPNATAERRAVIEADIATLESSAARCEALRPKAK